MKRVFFQADVEDKNEFYLDIFTYIDRNINISSYCCLFYLRNHILSILTFFWFFMVGEVLYFTGFHRYACMRCFF